MKTKSKKNKNSTLITYILIAVAGFVLYKALVGSYKKANEGIVPPEIAVLSITPPSPTDAPLPVLHNDIIFSLVNGYRASNGKPTLTISKELCGMAERRADYMMANGMEAFKKSKPDNHYGFDSSTDNYSGAGVGENLAANIGIDKDVLDIWVKSPRHNELLLLTSRDGASITKGCVATRVSKVGSITVLLVGDK